ncbi:hypothetical protein [Natronorubrum texcoconense]|uniref:Transposase zinc-ribbon domain-containing protein n=1 Tax=Natronorubrum texcoconense TaxID=1095776 RepID=A0A1G8VG58_9EURY|nr:hypothetical protein [Natronorubrum texcoconense]SDJ64305.1 hypothetical protein SAMN04515672_1299 [Natronorubrum texcoconense]
MRYPIGRCHHCGERLYEHIEGDYQCLNCNRRYESLEIESRAA